MYIQNATYKAVPTGNLTFPIAEGSIVTAGGVTGIVTENLAAATPTAMIYIAIGGTIDLKSEANKNVFFTDEQIAALGSDFNFVPAEEKPEKNELPAYTAEDAGKMLTVNNSGNAVEWVHAINWINIVSPGPYSIPIDLMYCHPPVHGTPGDRPDLEYDNAEFPTFYSNPSIFKTFMTLPIDFSCLSVFDANNLGLGIYMVFDDNLITNLIIDVNGNEIDHSTLLSASEWTGTQWDSGGLLYCLPITGNMTITLYYND